MSKNSSPFAKTDFVPIEQPYHKVQSLWGLKLPTGKIVVNFDQGTSYARLREIAEYTNSEVITVKGWWTFTPIISWECPGCTQVIEVPGENENDPVEEHDDEVWHTRCWIDKD